MFKGGESIETAKHPAPGPGELEPTLRLPTESESSLSKSPRQSESSASKHSIGYITDGLRNVEAARASTIGLLHAVICGACLVWLPALRETTPERNPVLGGLFALMFVMSLIVWRRAKVPDLYTQALFRTYGVVAVLCSMAAVLYLGPFSPTTLAVTLGISFFGQSDDRLGALLICGSAVGICSLIMIGVVSGSFPDVGVFLGVEAGVEGMLFMTLMVPLILSITFIQARWTREATKRAMSVAVSSAMDVKLKNVQLEEAQAELQRIFGPDGLVGQYTGRLVDGYRLGPLLGRGASGEVYDAVEEASNRRFAIKLLLGQDSQSPAMIARFKREGEISIEISSSHVAKVSRVGCSAAGILYILMERLEGDDLARLLRERGRLSVNAALTMVRHVCRGLEQAHRSGVIHRDVKPHNIFLHRPSESKGVWKVLDFGISKWASSNSTITKLGIVVGTPRYMSPEQARGEPVDHRSDIYSLGAVLYRCLTGLPPYSVGGLGALSAAAFQRPVSPSRLVPGLDLQIAAVLAVAMAPKPAQRFQSASAFSKAFKSALEGRLDSDLQEASKLIAWNRDRV